MREDGRRLALPIPVSARTVVEVWTEGEPLETREAIDRLRAYLAFWSAGFDRAGIDTPALPETASDW